MLLTAIICVSWSNLKDNKRWKIPLFICIDDFTVFLFFPFPPENNLLILFSTKLTTQDILSEANGRKCRQGMTSKENCLWRRIETILRKISAKGKVSGYFWGHKHTVFRVINHRMEQRSAVDPRRTSSWILFLDFPFIKDSFTDGYFNYRRIAGMLTKDIWCFPAVRLWSLNFKLS